MRFDYETMQGDELVEADLANATWRVRQVFLDIDDGEPVLTLRVEAHGIDFLTVADLDD